MTKTDWQDIIDNYVQWIKDNTTIKSIKDGKSCEITTPLLDRHNDHVEIYIMKHGNEFKITDGGYTISDLVMSGLDINTPKREQTLKTTLNGFGIKLGPENEIYVEADMNNIGQKKHYFLQAILAINDMYVLSQEHIFSFFKEDVEMYFKSNEIIHIKDIKLTGKTGFVHNIDFSIPETKTKPERLIKTVNTPRKDPVTAAIFAFDDVAKLRETKSSNYVLYNDIEKPVSPDVLSALTNYGINSIPWSQKERCLAEFALN